MIRLLRQTHTDLKQIGLRVSTIFSLVAMASFNLQIWRQTIIYHHVAVVVVHNTVIVVVNVDRAITVNVVVNIDRAIFSWMLRYCVLASSFFCVFFRYCVRAHMVMFVVPFVHVEVLLWQRWRVTWRGAAIAHVVGFFRIYCIIVVIFLFLLVIELWHIIGIFKILGLCWRINLRRVWSWRVICAQVLIHLPDYVDS